MNELLNKLRAWYAGLQRREQRMVTIGGVTVAVLILVLGILTPLQSAVSSAVKRNETKRADLAWMQANAPEIRASGNQPAADTGEAPVVLVDRVGREAGLGSALRGTQPMETASACSWKQRLSIPWLLGSPRSMNAMGSRSNRSPWIALPGRER